MMDFNVIYIRLIVLLSEKRIVLLLVSDGGRRSVSRIDACLVGQGEEVRADTFTQLVEIAAFQVGASDASVEEHVATEHTGCFCTMIYHAAG